MFRVFQFPKSYIPAPVLMGRGCSRAFAFAVNPCFDFAGIHEHSPRQFALSDVPFIVGVIKGGTAQAVAFYCVG